LSRTLKSPAAIGGGRFTVLSCGFKAAGTLAALYFGPDFSSVFIRDSTI